jgi:peptidoglycan/xylan/chitin deacetylase (PgdA/CDA1 family)
MTFQVAITVDVDGESGLPDGGRHLEDRLTARSERLYGIARGVPRILGELARSEVAATFYVPGVVAALHGETVLAIVGGAHEVGHHGHAHRRPDTLTPDEQRADVRAGLEAIAAASGSAPEGYRAPGWELTPATLAAVREGGMTFDSSLMGDDRPYVLPGGGMIELPVHWSLDDAPHFATTADPSGLSAVWQAELRAAAAESRLITYTMHPEIIGRPSRIGVLSRLIEAAHELGAVFVTHGEAARRHRG